MKGIGKTAFLSHCAVHVVPEVSISAKDIIPSPSKAKVATPNALLVKAKATYITLNGGQALSRTFEESRSKGLDCASAFGHVLLAACGIPRPQFKDLRFDQSLELFRFVLKVGNEESLVICVDEVGMLGDVVAEQLLSRLMSEMDAGNGKLIFIFAHILQTFLDKQTTGSGRRVKGIPLCALPVDVWMDLLDEKTREAANKHSGTRQLLLSCCGLPRAICDGFPEACKQTSVLVAPSETELIKARVIIAEFCKFQDFLNKDDFHTSKTLGNLGVLIQQWFNIQGDINAAALARDGLLLRVKKLEEGHIDFFSPILMQVWADTNVGNLSSCPLAFHLQQVYSHDAILGRGAEKKMEGLLFHFEAVLRLATEGREFTLGGFYKTEHICAKLRDTIVTAPLPPDGTVIREVPDFTDMDFIIAHLTDGYIMVSQFDSEPGVEYLSGYLTHTGKLLVGATQCRFVQSKTETWTKLNTKINVAMKGFELRNIPCFHVLYVTADKSGVKSETCKNAVVYTEQAMFDFTSKLGPLRLHTEKLGTFMRRSHPWLGRMCSDSSLDVA